MPSRSRSRLFDVGGSGALPGCELVEEKWFSITTPTAYALYTPQIALAPARQYDLTKHFLLVETFGDLYDASLGYNLFQARFWLDPHNPRITGRVKSDGSNRTFSYFRASIYRVPDGWAVHQAASALTFSGSGFQKTANITLPGKVDRLKSWVHSNALGRHFSNEVNNSSAWGFSQKLTTNNNLKVTVNYTTNPDLFYWPWFVVYPV